MVLDLFLGFFVIAVALMGLRSGLIHESVTLLGLIVGLAVAGRFSGHFSGVFLPYLHTRGAANLAAFLVLLVGGWALMLVLGAFVRELLDGIHLGWVDNLAGGVLGLAKGLFLAELVILILMAVPAESIRGAVTDSWLGRRLAALAPELLDLVPPVLRYWNPF